MTRASVEASRAATDQPTTPELLQPGSGDTPLDGARVVGFPLNASAEDGEFLYRRHLVEFVDQPHIAERPIDKNARIVYIGQLPPPEELVLTGSHSLQVRIYRTFTFWLSSTLATEHPESGITRPIGWIVA